MRTSTRAIITTVLVAIMGVTFSIDAAVVGLWRLNEGIGDSVHDESGNNNHALITGPAWAVGFHSGALEYDGIDDSVRVPHSVSLASPVNAITMEAWFYAFAFNNEFHHIINKFGVYVLSVYNHVPAIALRVGSHVWWKPAIDTLPLNEWVYFAATFDGLKKLIFINGTMVAEGDLTGTINEGAYSDPVEIGGGRKPSENALFYGKIDEACISNHAMTPAEILERYHTFIGPLPQLIPVPSPTYNRRPVFKWHPFTGATSYTIQVDASPAFTSLIVNIGVSDTTFTPLTDLPMATIYWRIAAGQPLVYSDISSFVIQDTLVPLPIQYTPNPTLERRPTLKWHSVKGASTYQLLADNDIAFTSTVISISLQDTAFTPLSDLPTGKLYWKVKSDLLDKYSAVSSLIIQSDTIPFLYAYGGKAVASKRPSFRWKPVSGATTYKIEIDTLSSFTSSIVSIELADTQFVPLTDLAEKMYYWHVSCNKNSALFSPTDSVQVDYDVGSIYNQKNSVTLPCMTIYPNPFKGVVTINCTKPLHANARLFIYRIDGTLIRQFKVTAGQKENRITWDGRDIDNKKVANGMYVIKLKSGTMNLVKRVISID